MSPAIAFGTTIAENIAMTKKEIMLTAINFVLVFIPHCMPLHITGWQWRAAELPVRVHVIVCARHVEDPDLSGGRVGMGS